jgi:hypothetical protein
MSKYGYEWDKFFPNQGNDVSKIQPRGYRGKIRGKIQSDPWQMLGVIGFDEHKKNPFVVYSNASTDLFEEKLFAIAIFSRDSLSQEFKDKFFGVFVKWDSEGGVREIMIAFDTPFVERDGRLIDAE